MPGPGIAFGMFGKIHDRVRFEIGLTDANAVFVARI